MAAPTLQSARLIADASGRAMAERLQSRVQGMMLDASDPDETANGLTRRLHDICRMRHPCVFVGSLEWLVLALAPALVGMDRDQLAPVVAVTPDGAAAIPLLGLGRGAEALARSVADALGVLPAGRATEGLGTAVPAPRPGRLAVIGLGPGAADLMAPAVREELDRAQDIVGYTTYVRMAGPFRPDQRLLDSDNRREMDRARLAFELAAQGRHVVVVSSGDPGVFAMAAAVVEALDQSDDPAWREVDLAILPGISAAQAVAARAGAPLGHDFCMLSLSDNLKPWSLIERRLEHAALADLVIALYNPSSKARPWQLSQALDLLRRHRAPSTPVVLGRDVGRPDERVIVTTLGEIQPDQVDMRTLVILGSSQTRQFPRRDGGAWVYTPRWYPAP
ncbi:precorrin-3B C(17)-methyltransferase [Thiocystis violascens]|uniref:Precorrin-3B C17-methyltransferase n=1 Tax=Thiocystis violascens (strain ATCC 17096 / DSM 198 / 6111) TaxID=765911 RepID=I3Y9I7_THIV6|nr:precorrin-3B C(17)-methyltransferase [Thiocystis violascens]AFL73655.1 precorrin-3B C17-methyltransferase [Thiocystis violascens DSM 198]